MTDQELRDLVGSLAVSQAETDRQIKELRASQQETDWQIKQTNKQFGELGNRWGGYTEGLIYPSIEKVLLETFKMGFVNPRAKSHEKGHNLEIDVLGFANSTINTAFVVEVKSRANEDDINQLLNTLAGFPKAFPHHAGKKVYGMLAAVDIPLNVRQRAIKLGLYVMRAAEDSFKLIVPAKFQPKNYGQN